MYTQLMKKKKWLIEVTKMKKIGVLALQGAFKEHVEIIESLGHEAREVRKVDQLNNIDGIILPGGESTAIGKLLDASNLKEILQTKIKEGFPVWGTCAGMILLAKKIVGYDIIHLPLMDIEVVRNGYGRQLSSFTVDKDIKGIDGGSLPLVFIRAPYIQKVGENVSILCEVDGKIVAAQENNILATSFHPELTEDFRMHQYFINMIK